MQITRYELRTRFDITQTGITGRFKPDGEMTANEWNEKRNQQRNLETIIQILCLRAQLTDVTTPVQEDDQWVFTFNSDTENAWGPDLELFVNDARNVPMITIPREFGAVMLEPAGPKQNIWLKRI